MSMSDCSLFSDPHAFVPAPPGDWGVITTVLPRIKIKLESKPNDGELKVIQMQSDQDQQ